MKKLPSLAILVVMLLTGSGAALAHTLFIKPDLVRDSAKSIGVSINNGTFAVTEAALQSAWIAHQGILAPNGGFLSADEFELNTNISPARLTFNPATPGTYTLEIATKRRLARQSAEDFERYLLNEGLKDAKSLRAQLEESNVAVAERYTKWAKAIVVVDGSLDGQLGKPLGHPVEFVALTHPASITSGDTFHARLLINGQPAPNRLIYAGTVDNELELRSDAQGNVNLPISVSGQWYLKHIDIARTGHQEYWYSPILVWLGQEEPRIPYESNWATLVFEVK